MNKAEDLKKQGQELENSLRDFAKNQLTSWQNLSRDLLNWHDTEDFHYLVEVSKVIPIVSHSLAPYLYINLETGSLLAGNSSWSSPQLIPCSQLNVLAFANNPNRLSVDTIHQEFKKAAELKERWGRRTAYKRKSQVSYLPQYSIGIELSRWLIVTRIIAFGHLGPVFEHITSAIRDFGLKLKDGGVEPTNFEMWQLIDQGFLDLTTDRRVVIKNFKS